MKLIVENKNYAAYVVEIQNKIDLEGCDNICATKIFANNVIISKDTEIGTKGLYFPVETKLSYDFLSNNNLYRDPGINKDNTKTGFFEINGRIRAMKLRGNQSDGFFIPLKSLEYTNININELNIGDIFDTINNIKICEKYIVRNTNIQKSSNKSNKINKKLKRFDRLIEGQFRLHIDTEHLDRNIFKLKPDDIISITTKMHGSSFVVGKVLVKRKLSWIEKILQKIKVKIDDKQYDVIYSSRKVIKNQYINTEAGEGFYKKDIWKIVADQLTPYLMTGQQIYGEIVGYVEPNKFIQKPYDYGCANGDLAFYIYRITSTNIEGQVIEWSAKQVQQWCKLNNLNVVPELYYGYAKDLFNIDANNIRDWHEQFLMKLKEQYLEKICTICTNKVPDEGIVLRIEKPYIEVYKFKSFMFKEFESKQLDKGEVDIEESN